MVVVGESGRPEEALARMPALRPHVAVLHARPTGMTGAEICRRIRVLDRTIRCLILTADEDKQGLRDAVLAGASGYILKKLPGRDIAESIRRVAAGEVLFDPEEEEKILSGECETAPPGPVVFDGLGRKESQVLELLGRGMTNREIADELVIAEKTVKNYVSSVLAKLGMVHRTQAALYVAEVERGRAAGPDPGASR
jgi:DNA-binding NarL/FixJ family response regulator